MNLGKTLIGQTLGSYRIVGLLGEGGMGVVFLAEHEALGRKAAIKLLRPEFAEQEEVIQRFFNEARAANQIKHPGIVDIYDYAQSEVGAFLVMEFLEGESLADLVEREGSLSLERTVLLVRRIASPLTAAHAAEIVHRDLKPDNIFVLPDLDHPGDVRVKLLDFGIAKLKEFGDGKPGMQTATGMLLGTPFYMSPEQCHGARAVDHLTDIYALGVIAYQLLSGRLPFNATGFGELVLMHQMEPPPALNVKVLGIPPAVEAQVLRALAKDPAARFESAEDFAAALALAAGLAQAGTMQPPLHEVAQLSALPTAATLPRTVHSTPGELLPLAASPPTAAPPPMTGTAPPATSALAATQLATAAHPQQARPALPLERRSRVPLLAVFGGLIIFVTICVAIFVIARGDDAEQDPNGSAGGGTAKGTAALRVAKGTASSPGLAGGTAGGARKLSSNPDRAPMERVPAGPFLFGRGGREIALRAFSIDRHEVTVAQFRRCVRAGACDGRHLDGTEIPGRVRFSKSDRCNYSREGAANQPLNCVSHTQAAQYCGWAKKRLPSEAEWEKAARGTDGRRLPWLPKTAEDGKLAANCKHVVMRRGQKDGCGRGRTWAVASRSPAGDSPYGVQDTVGNVAEWVADWWHGDEPNIVAKADPKGPRSASRRVVRGGSFINTPSDLWTTTRIGLPPGYRLEDVGFRCAR